MAFETNENQDQPGTPADPTQAAADKPAAQAPAADAPADHTSVFLVAGERAFRSADDVVKNIENAQSHISTLEAERAADREKLAAIKAENERLRKIEEGLDGRNNSGNDDQTDQLSKDELAAQAAVAAVDIMKQNQNKEVQEDNLAQAEAAAKEAYGDQYVTKIDEIAKGLNMTLAAVDQLGKTSPGAFKRLFLPAEPGKPHVPSSGSVNVPAGDMQQGAQAPSGNVTKMRERERIAHVKDRMSAAGIEYGN